MVRFAGFLHPIVPDRTAFGAAVEGEAHGNNAENQCQSPKRHQPTPHPRDLTPKTLFPQGLLPQVLLPQDLMTSSQAFSSRPAGVPLHRMRSRISIIRNSRRGNTVYATRTQSIRTKG